MKSILADLLLALRLLRKSPGFSATVIAVLALGVGANTAIFSVVNAVLLHPFPYPGSERITFIGSTRQGENGTMPVTYPDFLDWKKQAQRFEQLAYSRNRSLTLTQVTEPANLGGAAVSASVWPLLGLPPLLGRTFTEAEDRPGATPVCVIGYALWQSRFGGAPDILNRTLTLDGQAYAVVGVMPPTFKFWAAELWVPAGLEADTEIMRNRVLRMNSWVVGKVKPGVTLAEAEAELNVIAGRLAQQYPDSNKGTGAKVNLLSDSVTGPVRRPLLVLLAAVGFVLLIACANVANLLLARATTRQREFAIRAALGASRRRLVAQMLLECLPLGLLGAGAGVLAGIWGLDALLLVLPPDAVPAEAQIHVSVPVMIFSLVLAVGTMFLFALLPALETSRPELNTALQEGGRGSGSLRSGRLRAGLIVAEVSLSLVLLVGAGLLIRSFARLQSVNPGFNAQNLLVMPLQLPEGRYRTGPEATRFFRELVERVQHLPAVTAAAATSNAPFMNGNGIPLITEGKTYTDLNQLEGVQFSLVLGDYFKAQGLRLTQGRTFTDADRAGSEPVIILNEAAVKKFLPNGNPIGQRVMLGLPANLITPGLLPPGLDKFQWSTVVGVVQSVRHFGLQSEPQPEAYIPVDQSWEAPLLRSNMAVLLRTEGDPLRVASAARAAVTALDRDQPIGRITTMEITIGETLRQSRFSMLLLGIFAGVALTLAVVGIYGVVAWNVAQRTRELGIRSALGATRQDVVRLVIGQGMRVVLLGLVVGLGGSLALSRTLQTLLFETSAFDPWTFCLVAACLMVVALLACLLPALRATRISPLIALRSE
ncbi:MAG: ABC transporter permease [Opitutae bacterium]|nr:ABC transporter permease [Opitutae bacterium]